MKMFLYLQNWIRNSSQEKAILLPVLIVLLSLSGLTSKAATKTSAGTGNWGTAATWSPSGVPASGDDVIIRSGDVVTIDNVFTCNNLSLGNAINANATLQITAAGNSLTINGDLKINPGAKNKIFVLDAGPGTLNIAGTFGTWAATGTNSIDVGSGTINFTPAVTISTTKQDITFTGAGVVTFNAAFTDQQNKLTPFAGCTVNFKSSYVVNTTAANWAGKGTAVLWNGSSITPTTAITFNNIETHSSASATLNTGAGAVTASGSFTLASGSTFTTNKSFEVGGDWTNNGGTFSGSSYTVTLNGTSNTIGGTASTAFGTLQIGRTAGAIAVSYTVNYNTTCNYLSINGSTAARTLSIASNKTFTVNNDATITQPTSSAVTSLLSVGAGSCTISGNLIFSGTNATTTRVAKIDVTSGAFELIGSITWMANTVVETEVITVSTGTVTFGSSQTLASASGTITATGAGTINFNGSSAPSFLFGGTTAPAFSVASGSTVNFSKGFTNTVTSLTFASGSTIVIGTPGSPNELTIAAGTTITNNGTLTVYGDITALAAASFINGSNAVLQVTGTIASAITLTATASGNVVKFTGTSSQTIPSATYNNLILQEAGTKTLSGNVSVSNAITLSNGAILNQGTYTLSGAASLNMSGTSELILSRSASGTYPELSGTYTLTGGTITLEQTAGTATLRGINYYNLKLTGSRPCDLSAVASIQGTLVIQNSSSVINNTALVVGGVINYASSASSTLSGNIVASGLVLSAGTLNDGGFSITLNGADGWTNNGGTFTPSGTVTFSGSSASSIAGSVATTFKNLTLNNAGGVTLNVSPAAPTVVSGALTLTNGVITTTASNILKLTATATSGSGSASSYVNGPMIKTGNSDFTFPVGKAGRWMRVGASGLTTATTEITAEYFASPYADTSSKSEELKEVSQIEYWDVNRTVSSDPVKLKFYWEDLSASGIYNCEYLTIAHYTGGLWREEPATFTGGYCTGQASGSITMDGYVSTFSPFGFGASGGGALPIKLVSFNAVPKGNTVEANWITSLEINNDYFTVERSTDGSNFTEVARVTGAGNSTLTNTYRAVDESPLKGISYYRLRQTDFDGQYTYSNLVAVTMGEQAGFKLFPNPAQSEFYVNVSDPSGDIQMNVFDMAGRLIYGNTFPANKGAANQTVSITTAGNLPPGVYFVNVSANGTEFKEKLMVQ